MRRRTLPGLTAAVGLARPALLRAESATTLKFVPCVDPALLDPAVSAFVTRNHVMMVYDTLFAMDADGIARPRMLAGHSTEQDGLTWTLRLRDGLRFHDGASVLERDLVASLRRWQVNDAYGQALAAATDELSAPNDTDIRQAGSIARCLAGDRGPRRATIARASDAGPGDGGCALFAAGLILPAGSLQVRSHAHGKRAHSIHRSAPRGVRRARESRDGWSPDRCFPRCHARAGGHVRPHRSHRKRRTRSSAHRRDPG